MAVSHESLGEFWGAPPAAIPTTSPLRFRVTQGNEGSGPKVSNEFFRSIKILRKAGFP